MSARALPTNARKSFGDIAPKLAELSDEVLFGDVWERAQGQPIGESAPLRHATDVHRW